MSGRVSNPVATLALHRTTDMTAVSMIGDDLLGLVRPERHVAVRRLDVAAADAPARPFAGGPGSRRTYGVVQAAAGLRAR